MQKITINRALVELKRLDDRIQRAIDSGLYVTRTTGTGNNMKIVGGLNQTSDQVAQKIQGSFDQVDTLVKQREQYKSKIVLSNATTKIKILGREMTVAEAIELKSTVVLRTKYLDLMKRQFGKVRMDVDTANAALDVEIQAQVSAMCSSDKKIDEDMLSSVSKVKKHQKEAAIFDPQNVETRIKKLEDEISQLTDELNFVLSDSNSQTFIEVDI